MLLTISGRRLVQNWSKELARGYGFSCVGLNFIEFYVTWHVMYTFPGFPLASDNGAFHLYEKTVFLVRKLNRTGLATGNFSDKKNLQRHSSCLVFTEMIGKSLNHLLCHTIPMLLNQECFFFGWASERVGKRSSLKLNGGPESRMSFSRLVTWFSYFFSRQTVQQVFPPSHPLTNSCLKFIEVYQPLGSFFPIADFDSVIVAMVIEMSLKCCCIVVWQTNGIQCARNTQSWWNGTILWKKIFWKIFKCRDMLNTHPNSLKRSTVPFGGKLSPKRKCKDFLWEAIVGLKRLLIYEKQTDLQFVNSFPA